MMTPYPLPADKGLPVGTLAELPQLLRDFGLDPWELLEQHGVRRDMMHKPLAPLPVLHAAHIMDAAVAASGCGHLGLLLGQRASLDTAGPLRHAMCSAATGRGAVQALLRHVHTWYPAMRMHAEEEDGWVVLSLALDGQFPGDAQLLAASLAATVKHLEGAFERSWRPAQIHLAVPEPEAAEAYQRFFRAPVFFSQPRHAVVFAAAGLDAPRTAPPHQQGRALQQHLAELDAKTTPDFPTRVRHVIESLLPGGDCTVERVAELFAMHRFTLYRYLQESGTTFEDLLAETRADMAASMLRHTSMTIGDVALALGYSTSTSFGRAFVRWYGKPPKDWRKQALGIVPADAEPQAEAA